MNDFDLNLWRVFVTVYRTGSTSRAAAQLQVTQPAVSNALGRLRTRMNDLLFVREGQRMVPTPLARAVAPEVQAALDKLTAAARHEAAFAPEDAARTFTLAMREAMELPLLGPLVDALAVRAPRLQLRSVPIDRRRIAGQLASGEVDFAVDVPFAGGGDLRLHPLFAADLCLAARRRHPLLRGRVELARWLAARHVAVSGRASGPLLEDLGLRQLGVTREVAVRCQNYFAACQLVAQSDLVLVLPTIFGSWFRRVLPLDLAPLPFPSPPLQVYLFEHAAAEVDPAHAWMRDLLLELAADAASMEGVPGVRRRAPSRRASE